MNRKLTSIGREMKNKAVFVTDAILVPFFAFTLYSGIELHVAGQSTNHAIWHNWAVFHTIISTLFLMLVVLHVSLHWRWYKGLKNQNRRKKGRVTLGLSCIFSVVVVTGALLLFCVDGAGSPVGRLHYVTGTLTGLLCSLHILKRLRILRKGMRSAFAQKPV